MKIKLPRKLKKRIIKSFGRGTYYGIVHGYLTIEKYSLKRNRGCCTRYTGKPFYHDYQRHPYITFPKIKHYG